MLGSLPVIHQEFINAVDGHLTAIGLVPIGAEEEAAIEILEHPETIASRYGEPLENAPDIFHPTVTAFLKPDQVPASVQNFRERIPDGQGNAREYFDRVVEIMGLGAACTAGLSVKDVAPPFINLSLEWAFDGRQPYVEATIKSSYDARDGKSVFQLVDDKTGVVVAEQPFPNKDSTTFKMSPRVPGGSPIQHHIDDLQFSFRVRRLVDPKYFIRYAETLADYLRDAEQVPDPDARSSYLAMIAGLALQGGLKNQALPILKELSVEIEQDLQKNLSFQFKSLALRLSLMERWIDLCGAKEELLLPVRERLARCREIVNKG